ncbi:MAG TPA: hypothetical protein VFQ92_07475, partial [Blastocatellia bacterium]|nr:hypothetical protein [Blastocatellia bacterium]
NLWVPNRGSVSVTVVRAATGQVLATLTGNGLDEPISAAFDGERILVTSVRGVSLWKAADLTPLISFFITGTSFGACSDGVNFWFTLSSNNRLVRF